MTHTEWLHELEWIVWAERNDGDVEEMRPSDNPRVTFHRYCEMQAATARREGFEGIARLIESRWIFLDSDFGRVLH